MGKVISFVSLKGGCGKSTACFVIANYLATQGHSVLCVDSDPNMSLKNWWARGEGLPFTVATDTEAPLKMASASWDYILIDSKARPADADIQGLAGSDLVILCSTPDPMAIETVIELVGMLPPGTNFSVLVGLSPPRPSKDGQAAIAALSDAGIPVFPKPIRRLKAYSVASLKGTTIKGQGINDWKEIFKEILAV